MANLILPLRAGEIIRPYLFGRKFKVSKTAVFSSVAVERILDLTFVIILLCLAAFSMPIPPGLRKSAYTSGSILVILTGVLWAVFRTRSGRRNLARMLEILPGKIRGRGIALIGSVSVGLQALSDIPILISSLALSAGIWLMQTLVVYFYLRAFDLVVSWYAPLFVLGVVNLGMAIPSSPGAIGVAHLLYVVALSLFGVPRSSALAFAITIHGVSYVVVTGLGLLSLWWQGLTVSQIRQGNIPYGIAGTS